MRSRRGFTVVELIVAMLLMMAVGGAMYKLLNSSQRLSRTQFERADMQSNMRAGALVIPAELRELGYDSTAANGTQADIYGMGSDSVVVRAIRASGVICNLANNQITIDTVRNYASLRLPTTTDSLMIFAELDPSLRNDDVWVRRAITAVASGTCTSAAPYSSRSGLQISTNATRASGGAWPSDSFTIGSPVRVFEKVVYKFYSSGGRTWLGSYSLSGGGSIQPLIGPLVGGSGNSGFAYLDSAGTATTDSARVRTMQIRLVARSDRAVSSGPMGSAQTQYDTLVTLVALRNTLR
jgi:Tfp pilus assembly protein PilW